jgi:hypothetical protein
VELAITEEAHLSAARYTSSAGNKYHLRPYTKLSTRDTLKKAISDTLRIAPEIASAAALVAEADALADLGGIMASNVTAGVRFENLTAGISPRRPRGPSGWSPTNSK